MRNSFYDYYRCPENIVNLRTANALDSGPGYFRFGPSVVGFGQLKGGPVAHEYCHNLFDAYPLVELGNRDISLPFDVDDVVRNLRCEIYAGYVQENETVLPPHRIVRALYYTLRPFMSVRFRRHLQRIQLRGKTKRRFPHWPVDRTVDQLFESLMMLALQTRNNEPIPFIWFWPEGVPGTISLTHDVETSVGRDFCGTLMDINDQYGFKSSFQVVPEKRYEVTDEFLDSIRRRGFEVAIHDLNHDGNLFLTREEFFSRAKRINEYARRYNTEGFRAGQLYRNLRWSEALEIQYDMSLPNAAHLDPQGGGCCTVMPFFVGNLLEIPVTCTQDYSIFHILNDHSIDLWKEQCRLILNGHGLISLIVHPDYIIEERARQTYKDLLQHLSNLRREQGLWATVPAEINRWCRLRQKMRIVLDGDDLHIEGEGSERARIAYAEILDGKLNYTLGHPPRPNGNAQPLETEATSKGG
jgi:hypothetical protein